MEKNAFTDTLLHAWDETVAELTPEERKLLAQATPEVWAQAATECVKDRNFWAEVGTAFVNGFFNGLVK